MYRLSIGFALLVTLVMAQNSSYDDSIRQWQNERDSRLRAEDSWLTLAGLFWLKPGDNTIGSADSNDFVLPKDAPANVGRLHYEGDSVIFTAADGSSRALTYNEEKPDTVQAGSVSFYLIKRSGKPGIRAKDAESPVRKNFQGLKYFPINSEFRFEAKFIPEVKKIPILNVLGQTDLEESPGIVEFTYKGQQYRLRPIYEDQTLFFLFKDPTNKTETYQAGRMLNTPLPVDSKVDLDFNRSYNPPCTFTPYATCPLPPKENTLPFPVEAGEKRYGKGHADYSL
ncbi:MAG: DUF1684 domain-containing protein [Acidobacteriaceae bacterium]|nr:DUF1684 domain-containing protein [Acidobacteriaceae bacterium]MBV9766150.1 DUF1684 domain-containing protein [Acidobacteriaceae bacterium]